MIKKITKKDLRNTVKLFTRTIKYKRLYGKLPVIPGQILFDSFHGRKCDCNPYYIYEYMLNKGMIKPEQCIFVIAGCFTKKGLDEFKGTVTEEDYKILERDGVVYKHAQPSDFPEGVKLVTYYSDDYFKAVMTSEVIVTNCSVNPYATKKKGQFIINTWHGGGCYKTFGWGNKNEHRIDNYLVLKKEAKFYDLMLADNKKMAKVMHKVLFVPENKIRVCNMPRNDMLISKDPDTLLRDKVRSELGVNQDELLVLYATTFRSKRGFNVQGVDNLLFDFDKIGKALESKFGKKVKFLYRAHYYDGYTKVDNIIDATNYKHVQELLVASDVLISDFSSISWDFALTYKPGFLFCKDLDEYSNTRGFHTPISEWAYPLAKNEDELCELIDDYDDTESLVRISSHLVDLGHDKSSGLMYLSQLIKENLNESPKR